MNQFEIQSSNLMQTGSVPRFPFLAQAYAEYEALRERVLAEQESAANERPARMQRAMTADELEIERYRRRT